MPMYVLLSKLTPDGRRTLHSNPKRLEEVNQEIGAFGCKVHEQYALLGQYDFLSIIEAPDNSTVAHLSVDLGSRGTVDISTIPAIPRSELYEKLTGEKQLGHE